VKPQVWNKHDPQRPRNPRDCVYVGRPSRWGNPFEIGRDGDRELVIARFRAHVEAHPKSYPLEELRGKHLVCWCAPRACHADVLLELANK